MFEIVGRNINSAWVDGVRLLKQSGVRRSSRNGDVLELPSGCVTRYLRPMERVLFCAVRDANPFFHLFEALWILAGRDDVVWQLEALQKRSKSGQLPLVVLPRIPATYTTITDPSLYLFGVLEGTVQSAQVVGDEGVSEYVRIESLTVTELV